MFNHFYFEDLSLQNLLDAMSKSFFFKKMEFFASFVNIDDYIMAKVQKKIREN